MIDPFAGIGAAPPDAVFGIVDRFNKAVQAWKTECEKAGMPETGPAEDTKPISLVVGAYRDEHGEPWVLPTVRGV